MWRAVLFVFTGLFLTGCGSSQNVGPEYSGIAPVDWLVKESVDRITDKVSISATITTTRVSYTKSRKSVSAAAVSVSCSGPDMPIVLFLFDFPVGSNGSAFLEYRFDQSPGQLVKSSDFTSGFEAVYIRDPKEVRTFIEQASVGDTLLVQVKSSITGISTAEFRSRGGGAAMDTLKDRCKWH